MQGKATLNCTEHKGKISPWIRIRGYMVVKQIQKGTRQDVSMAHTHITERRGSRTNMDPACNKRSFVCNKGGTRTAREIYATICPFGQHACVVDRAPHLISLHLHLVLRNHYAMRNVKVSKRGVSKAWSLLSIFLLVLWFPVRPAERDC